jgi:hypothetical protein
LCAGWHIPCRITTCWVWLLELPSPFICATIVCSLVVASYIAHVSLCLGLLLWTATGLLELMWSEGFTFWLCVAALCSLVCHALRSWLLEFMIGLYAVLICWNYFKLVCCGLLPVYSGWLSL